MIEPRPNEPSDREVLASSLDDPRAFSVLFERHFGDIWRFLDRRVERIDAEDLAVETFVVALNRRDSFDSELGDVRPWLFGIASNLLRNHRRSELRRLEALTRLGSSDRLISVLDNETDQQVDAAGMAVTAARALAQLDHDSRDLVTLIAGTDLTLDEVATALGISTGALRTRLWRARRKLQDLMGINVSLSTQDPTTSRAGEDKR
jgi:RNA polymerase sigma-70 factor (ECF subfamily)